LCRRNIGYVGGDGSGSGLSVRGRGCGRVVRRSLGKKLRGLNSVSREGVSGFFSSRGVHLPLTLFQPKAVSETSPQFKFSTQE
jgi:hypothetical protein